MSGPRGPFWNGEPFEGLGRDEPFPPDVDCDRSVIALTVPHLPREIPYSDRSSDVDLTRTPAPVEWEIVEEICACAICARPLAAGAGYVARMDVYADPALPPTSGAELETADFAAAMAAAIAEAQKLSAEELQDGVHRRFEFRLCPACHRDFLANPLGLPRRVSTGKN